MPKGPDAVLAANGLQLSEKRGRLSMDERREAQVPHPGDEVRDLALAES